jgi:hypothetical protein
LANELAAFRRRARAKSRASATELESQICDFDGRHGELARERVRRALDAIVGVVLVAFGPRLALDRG